MIIELIFYAFMNHNKISREDKKYLFIKVLTIFILFEISIILFNPKKYSFIKNIEKTFVFRNLYTELKDIQNYVNDIFNGTLIDKDVKIYKNFNPKISIVITIYNGEAYLKTALLSIQNQNFKDIEIVMVDDGSKDNSIGLIKKLMRTDPRIVLYKNKENKGALYSKTKGILLSKGKYVLLLDEDDILVPRNAFTTLYNEAEKYDLDILRFGILMSTPKIFIIRANITKPESPIIFQPELSTLMYRYDSNGNIKQYCGILTNLFVKKSIYLKAIEQIDKKYLNAKINFNDDFFIFYKLTKIAYNFKDIDRYFYIVLLNWNRTEPKIKFRIEEKIKNQHNLRCFAFLNYIEFILKNTDDSFYDKKFAIFTLNNLLLKTSCRSNTMNKEKSKIVLNLFLENKHILEKDKKEIKKILKEM